MKSEFETFTHNDLNITIVESLGEIIVRWQGMSDARNPGAALSPYLTRLAEKLRSRRVTVDLRQLVYMNSSIVGVILQFIKLLDVNSARVVVTYDLSVDWQRINCLCMKTIARTLSNVRVEET